MKLSNFWVLPFLIQGLAMFFDEFYFHRKRGLPLWERVGHPLDTLSVLFCYSIILLKAPTSENLLIYGISCLFSCALVTKDEFVHQKHCSGGESWLHAVLFILHPLVFIVAGLTWYEHGSFEDSNRQLWQALQFQTVLTVFFIVYQILYWGVLSKQKTK